MADARIHLFGGEQDGYGTDIDLRTKEVPQVFYIWPVRDHGQVSEASGKKRMVLAQKLAVLAYRFEEEREREGVAGGRELIYRRYAEADKASRADKAQPDPAV